MAKLIDNLFPHVAPLKPSDRRLRFMINRYCRPSCHKCERRAIYAIEIPQRTYWCRSCLPEVGREHLTMDWQMKNIVMPLARYIG